MLCIERFDNNISKENKSRKRYFFKIISRKVFL